MQSSHSKMVQTGSCLLCAPRPAPNCRARPPYPLALNRVCCCDSPLEQGAPHMGFTCPASLVGVNTCNGQLGNRLHQPISTRRKRYKHVSVRAGWLGKGWVGGWVVGWWVGVVLVKRRTEKPPPAPPTAPPTVPPTHLPCLPLTLSPPLTIHRAPALAASRAVSVAAIFVLPKLRSLQAGPASVSGRGGGKGGREQQQQHQRKKLPPRLVYHRGGH